MWRDIVHDALTNILFVLFLFGIAILAVSLFFYYRMLQQRTFIDIARSLGFRYYFRSYAMPRRFDFLSLHRRGRGRHASNIFLGRHAGSETVVFDYMFNRGLSTGKKWYYGSFSVMYHGRNCPSVRIFPKNMLPMLGAVVGYSEIALDGHPLSKHFSVYTTNTAFARSLLREPLVNYLSHHPGQSLEIDPLWFALGSRNNLEPEDLPNRLKQLEIVRTLLSL